MSHSSKPGRSLAKGRGCLVAAAATAGLLLAVAPAMPAFADDTTHITISRESGASQQLTLSLNKSLIVDLPVDAHEVIVSQPTIATANMRSKRRAILQGMGIGDTNMIFLDDRGAQIAALQVSVTRDASTLSNALATMLPGSNIKVQGFGDHLILSGTAQSQDDVTKAVTIAGQFAGSDSNVANIITVSGSQQVKLKVTVAEVSRSAVKQLGIDLNGAFSVGALAGAFNNASALGGASSVVAGVGNYFPSGSATAGGDGVGAGISVPGATLNATLHALEQHGLLRKLDEPTLTAMSGQAATFAVGGEVPVINPPTEANGSPTYSYKQIGVTLGFTPTVKSNGIIDVVVDSSVTDVDNTYSVSVAGTSVPGLSNRQAKTMVELPAGETLSIGGMFEDKVRQEITQLPGVGNIPILGQLFRSRDFIHQQTELVILVTPYLVTPGAAPALPTDGVVAAGDAEANFLGHMQKLYSVGGSPSGPQGPYHGSVGFALE